MRRRVREVILDTRDGRRFFIDSATATVDAGVTDAELPLRAVREAWLSGSARAIAVPTKRTNLPAEYLELNEEWQRASYQLEHDFEPKEWECNIWLPLDAVASVAEVYESEEAE